MSAARFTKLPEAVTPVSRPGFVSHHCSVCFELDYAHAKERLDAGIEPVLTPFYHDAVSGESVCAYCVDKILHAAHLAYLARPRDMDEIKGDACVDGAVPCEECGCLGNNECGHDCLDREQECTIQQESDGACPCCAAMHQPVVKPDAEELAMRSAEL